MLVVLLLHGGAAALAHSSSSARRAPSSAARSVRLEVTRGGDVVHGEDYGAAPSVVLSRAEEAFGGGYLVSNLPGVAGRLARPLADILLAYTTDSILHL